MAKELMSGCGSDGGASCLKQAGAKAEVAFVVQDKWQRRGIGTSLLNHLIVIARRSGISGFTAEVLRANQPMQAVFLRTITQVQKLVFPLHGLALPPGVSADAHA